MKKLRPSEMVGMIGCAAAFIVCLITMWHFWPYRLTSMQGKWYTYENTIVFLGVIIGAVCGLIAAGPWSSEKRCAPQNDHRAFFMVRNAGVMSLALALLAFLMATRTLTGPHSSASSVNECINNLRNIDGAKQQWALEHHKQDSDTPTSEDIAVYLKDHQVPVCPAGGKYTLGRINEDPKCSIATHVLPQP